jgi:hypothetical protein
LSRFASSSSIGAACASTSLTSMCGDATNVRLGDARFTLTKSSAVGSMSRSAREVYFTGFRKPGQRPGRRMWLYESNVMRRRPASSEGSMRWIFASTKPSRCSSSGCKYAYSPSRAERQRRRRRRYIVLAATMFHALFLSWNVNDETRGHRALGRNTAAGAGQRRMRRAAGTTCGEHHRRRECGRDDGFAHYWSLPIKPVLGMSWVRLIVTPIAHIAWRRPGQSDSFTASVRSSWCSTR